MGRKSKDVVSPVGAGNGDNTKSTIFVSPTRVKEFFCWIFAALRLLSTSNTLILMKDISVELDKIIKALIANDIF